MKTKIYKIYTHDFEIFLRCAELEYGGLKTSIFNGGVLSREHILFESTNVMLFMCKITVIWVYKFENVKLF